MGGRLIVLLARSPADERCHKTLRPRAGARRIEALHRLLLDRTLRAAAAVESTDVRLVSTGELDRARAFALRRLAPERLQVAAQIAGALGERLHAAVDAAFADGYRRVVVIGGDTPELSAAAIESGFALLSDRAAVIGPSTDGGLYLLGLSAPPAPSLRWPRGALDTAAALAQAGYAVTTLPPLADVDSAADALALSARLRDGRTADDLLLRLALLDVLTGDARPDSAAAWTPDAPRLASRYH
jgi:glycosyltransferase A (GT-A) superfamily protein (DUF2064 family)